jgi:putative glycosyltransferase (TIGR04372 family)
VGRGLTAWSKVKNTIVGLSGTDAVGDFLAKVHLLSSVKLQFRKAHLTLVYNDNLPFKAAILKFCPYIDELVDRGGQYFDLSEEYTLYHTLILPHKGLHLRGFHPHFERSATFAPPRDEVDSLRDELIACGVRPDRWLAVMHYRQGATFPRGRQDTRRDVNPANFHQLAQWMVEAHGGQVVRLGHPGMDPAPLGPGYIDLSRHSLELQLYATSVARFMVATDSGPGGFGLLFKVPTVKTNAVLEDAWHSFDLTLPKNVLNWRGEVLSFKEAYASRPLSSFRNGIHEAYSFVDNTLDQLKFCVELLLERTAGCNGWRAEPASPTPPYTDVLSWPGYGRRGGELLDLSHMLGLPVRVVPAS